MSRSRSIPRVPTCSVLVALLTVGGIWTCPIEAQARRGTPGGTTPPTSATASYPISGQVVNAVTGTPVPRVLVRLNERAVLTDHDGNFQFDQVGAPVLNMQVTKPGFYLSTDPSEPPMLFLQPAQLSKALVVRLYPEALLTGTVTDPQGVPLPQILVSARRSIFDEMGRRWIPAAQGVTDSHGNFRLPVPAGDYKLETRYTTLPGSPEAVLPVSIPGGGKPDTSDTFRIQSGEEQHFDLHPVLGRAYTVTARLESSSEGGFPAVTARSSTGLTIPVSFQRNPRPDEGRLQLPSGTYVLTANVFTPDGGAQAEATLTVPDHDVSGVVLRLAPNPSIPIELMVDSSVTSDKTPPGIQQFGLALQPTHTDSDHGGGVIAVTTGRNRISSFNVAPGRYRLQSRINGEWYVKSASHGTSDLLHQDLIVTSGLSDTPVNITVSNQIGALQGTVKLNGTPSACWIYLIPNFPSTEPFMLFRSGADGGFNVPYLPPGGYQAIAFERRHSADYRSPDTLAPFTTYVRSVTITPGNQATLDMDAVSAAEQVP